MIILVILMLLICYTVPPVALAFVPLTPPSIRPPSDITVLASQSNLNDDEYLNVQINEFFKKPVPPFIKSHLEVRQELPPVQQEFDLFEIASAPPRDPGIPRPLWSVILASLPTGLVWYGYYKFCVEEELLEMELAAGKKPRGYGGYGTLGPFTYGLVLGPIAAILHLPGGINWATAGIFFIYYTQFLLYDRVNELYKQEGLDPPLSVYWCWPFFFPFNLIVGLRQVHFLSQYLYRQRGVDPPPNDPVADLFPFIKAPKFTWQEFVTTPKLWSCLLSNQKDIDPSTLPEPVQDFLKIGAEKESSEKKR